MYRRGVVTKIDEKTGKVKVRFEDTDNVESYWLPVIQKKTLKDKYLQLPDINEHVAVMLDERAEDGVVVGAIYSDADRVPVADKDREHVTFQDGTIIEYDRKNHFLNVLVKGNVTIKINGNASVRVDGHADVSVGDCLTFGCDKHGGGTL